MPTIVPCALGPLKESCVSDTLRTCLHSDSRFVLSREPVIYLQVYKVG